MSRTLFAVTIFFASLAVTVAAATAADSSARKAESVATVEVYKDPG